MGARPDAVDWLVERLALAAGATSRLVRVGAGSTLPGRVLEAVRPSYIERAAGTFPDGSVIVSGSNGKTTTTAMLRHILESAGCVVASNLAGANLRSGVATALLDAPPDADLGVFEVDEAALPSVVRAVHPRLLVLTNIVRDQLDRFGEPQAVAELLGASARALPTGAIVVANADDPLLWWAVRDTHPVGFALAADLEVDAVSVAGEPESCPACGAPLEFSSRTMAHFGRARCSAGCVRLPEPAVAGRLVADRGFGGVDVEIEGRPVRLRLGGVHTAYNALAAAAAARGLGLDVDAVVTGLEGFRPRWGRGERMEVGGRTLHTALMKNPVGAGVLMRQIAADPDVGAAVVAVSDRTADGRDISWIWDADFEYLAPLRIPVLASGTRARDVAVRLKHAGVTVAAVVADPDDALGAIVDRTPPGKTAAVFATYTSMLDLRRAAQGSRRGGVEER